MLRFIHVCMDLYGFELQGGEVVKNLVKSRHVIHEWPLIVFLSFPSRHSQTPIIYIVQSPYGLPKPPLISAGVNLSILSLIFLFPVWVAPLKIK